MSSGVTVEPCDRRNLNGEVAAKMTPARRLNQTFQEITEDAIERPTETAGDSRRATTTRAATLAKERAKPIEDDDKGLLLTMGKQIKELLAAIKIMFDA
ncbi:hypothetical protein CORC01_14288 [Colletotrichum orchidophilum]|uniref:Uncharacterized protein n=1 Tax=Colletotrichum orchidophilum TaxID=1209926 RepID=A0A1G4AMR0_9PEZI|nr:uncharacterized protein CORC01_14288 [Colletotrichum orchidophilum]OHE90411.1 hypothetical protein CORC01_14288 [Colletotrichum orchidophilum]